LEKDNNQNNKLYWLLDAYEQFEEHLSKEREHEESHLGVYILNTLVKKDITEKMSFELNKSCGYLAKEYYRKK
jgi:hypothetical protein